MKQKLAHIEVSADQQTLTLEREKRELSQQLVEAKEKCEQWEEKCKKLQGELQSVTSENLNLERLVSAKEKSITEKEGEVAYLGFF